MKKAPKPGKCRVCGCTHREPCNPPCSWQLMDDGTRDDTLCSTCGTAISELIDFIGSTDATPAILRKLVAEAREAI